MELHCPECGSIVYSRRSRRCGVCAKPLPESFQFPPEEAALLEADLREARRDLKHAVEENKRIAEERVRRIRANGTYFPPPLPPF
jgi:hypothetical protein